MHICRRTAWYQFLLPVHQGHKHSLRKMERNWLRVMAELGGNVFLLILGIGVALTLAEGGTRLLHLAPPSEHPGWFWQLDHELGWFHIPGASGHWFNPYNEYNVEVWINSHGLRDRQYTYVKPSGVRRILVLGDSYAEALQVPLEQTFHERLEQRLNATGDGPVEVISAGVAGYGTDQELLLFRRLGVRYDPDLVLLAFFPGNDFMNNYRPLEVANFGSEQKRFFKLVNGRLRLIEHSVTRPRGREKLRQVVNERKQQLAFLRPWLQEHSALYRFAEPVLRDAMPDVAFVLVGWGLLQPGRETKLIEAGPDYIPIAYHVYQQPLTPDWLEGEKVTWALIRALRDETAAIGARFAVVVLEAQEQIYDWAWDMAQKRYPAMGARVWNREQPNTRVDAWLKEEGIPYLDLLPAFQQGAEDGLLLHYQHDGHWTAAGHRLASDLIYDFVLTRGLLPPGKEDE